MTGNSSRAIGQPRYSWLKLARDELKFDVSAIDYWNLPLAPTALIFHEKEIVGFNQVSKEELEKLYVLPAFQGSGAAKILIDDAKNRGAHYLSVDEANYRARNFYEKHGWVYSGEDNPGSIFPATKTLKYILKNA